MKKRTPLKNIAVRVDEEKLKQAKALGVDTGMVFRHALDRAISRLSGTCVTCGKEWEGKMK